MSDASVLAIIPARGGSKGVKRKNLREIGGLSLLAWSIQEALQSHLVNRVLVSTEDAELAEEAQTFGAEVHHRQAHLATDTARTIEVVQELIGCQSKKCTHIIQLQPTSPFRMAVDIDAALELLLSSTAPSVVSVCKAEKSPHLLFRLDENQNLTSALPFPHKMSRRQDMDQYYEINGAIYAARIDWLAERDSFLSQETLAYVMPVERSLDIDTELDLKVAEALVGYIRRDR
ncbi:cytidylyltransferase domain-containing protein [Thalassospira alkalitolerans]|uniref:acylneuraminate cytidylyltransferase family protein n=1 Tax=Thalassospira alkalitolerans TaxID=1293890 RepID=UPI003AA9A475